MQLSEPAYKNIGGLIVLVLTTVWALVVIFWTCCIKKNDMEDKSDESDMRSMFPEITPETEKNAPPVK